MGSGILQCWINGPATGGIDDKIKMAIILLEINILASTIPAFHFRGKFGSPNKSIYSQQVVEIPRHLMGHSKISVTIPDEIYNDINEMALREKVKLSHLVTEALVDKLRKKREESYIQEINKAFEDNEIVEEQRQMAELIADNTDVEELPW